MEHRTLSETALPAHLAQARAILAQTRALITNAFQKEFASSRKPDQTWVTDIDLSVERLMRSRLKALFPGHGIIGEEFSEQDTTAEVTWVIDPIDGTASLRHRIPLFGTILALLHDSQPVLGLIDLPLLGRLYSGGRGIGVWLNGRPLRLADVADDSEVSSEIIAVGGRAQYVAAGMPQVFDDLMKLHPNVRTYGDCFGHALALEGAVGAMVDFDLRIWDVAASAVLVPEAGGKYVCYRMRGNTLAQARYDVLFGKPRVVDWITRTLPLC